MEFEINRIGTFVTYPRDATVFALTLARSGFIYTGKRKEIKCFLCGWRTAHLRLSFDDIVRNHVRFSPTCPIVQGEEYANVKWSEDPEARTNQANLNENPQIGSNLNLSQNQGNLHVSTTIPNEARSSLLSDGACITVEIDHQITSEGGAETHGQSHAGRSGDSHTASPSNQARAQTESVSSTQEHEFTNHALMIPSSTAGVSFTQASPSIPNVRNNSEGARANNDFAEMRPVPSYSELGIITKRSVQHEYAMRLKKRKVFVSCPKEHRLLPEELAKAGDQSADLPIASKQLNIKENARLSEKHLEVSAKCSKEILEAVQKENTELRDKTLCKICWDEKVEVLFTPCGHLLSCTECAAALTICPICRSDIQEKTRVTFC